MKKLSYYAVLACFLLMMFIAVPVCASSEGEGTLILPAEVKIIEKEAFYGVQGIDKVVIPEGATEIQSLAFVGCSLTEVVLPASLTYIAADAFDVEDDMDVTTPEDSYAFYRCVALGLIEDADVEETPEEYFTYEISNGKVTITAFDSNYTVTDVVVPKEIEGYPVTTIADNAFNLHEELKSVVLPDSVVSIGNSAFSHCTALEMLIIPEGLQSIGPGAFSACKSLTSATIPNGVTSIPEGAFSGCSALKNIELPSGLISIDEVAFTACTSLTDVSFPATLTSVGEEAFSRCNALTSVVLPEGVTSIGMTAFAYCESLQSVTVPSTVTNWGEAAFAGNESMTELVLTDGLTTIGHACFASCTALTQLSIPDSVTSIESTAFYNCSSLAGELRLRADIDLAEDAFEDCPNLTIVFVKPATPAEYFTYMISDNEVTITGFDQSCGITDVVVPGMIEGYPVTCIGAFDGYSGVFEGYSALASISIPDSVMSIGRYAFKECGSLTSINIPDSVTSIGDCVFEGCSSLTSINIPDGVTNIGYSAFEDCSSLTSINIPDSITSIGKSAFSKCSSLTSISIPEGVTSIGDYVFDGCSGLTSINIPDGVTNVGSSAFAACSSLTSINIPDGVTNVGSSAFAGCSSLTSINIPDGVTNIGSAAFAGCSSLTSIKIPGGVSYISNNSFAKCTMLSSVTIPEGVTTIANYAFSECTSLVNIVLPEGVKTIRDGAFSDCTNLVYISLPDGLETIGYGVFDGCTNLTSITIPGSMKEIKFGSFDNTNLTSVTILEGVERIGNQAFQKCVNLSEITLPESLLSIGKYAFERCYSLESIILPESLVTIFPFAFDICTNLTSIRIPASVDSIGMSAFSYAPLAVIYGESGSYAETYAKNNRIQFRAGMPIQASLIKGYVRLTDGTPLANAAVSITLADSTAVVRTNANGSWQYLCEPYERYTVSYAADGYTISPALEYVETDKSNIFLGTVYASTDADDLALTAPVFAAPSQDEVVFGSEVNVIWNTQMAAGAYRVEVTEKIEGSASDPVVSIVKTNSISIPVETGASYQVTVTALANESDADGISSTVSFSGAAASAMPVVTGFKFSSESVLTGAPVDFTIQADNASFVQLIVDGVGYETKAVVDGAAVLTREFMLAGERQIAFRAFGNGVWGDACETLTLQVSAEADLSPAVISCEEKVWVNTDVTVSWEPVDHATGYVIYLTDALGNIFDWEYKSALLTSITINAEYFVEPGSYQILVMTYGSGYSQSSARVDFVVTDEYIPWTGWVQHSTVNTYTSSACSTINGFVDYLDPVTVLGEENDAYLIEMKLSSGEYVQRYVFKMDVGTEQYTPDLTLQGSFSTSGDSIVLRATTNLPGVRAGVSLNGKELGSSAYPQRSENYTKTFIFSLSAPETETEYVIWAEDAQSIRIEKSIVVPAHDVNTPTPSVSPEFTAAPEETTVPEATATPSPSPEEEDEAVQIPSQPVETAKPTTCTHMSDEIHTVAVYDLEYMQLLCGSAGKLRMQASICRICGAAVSGDIPETINMQFYFHPILRYYDTSGNDKSYCMNSKYTSITCNAPLDVTKDLYLNGGTLYVQGKLTVSGKLSGVSQINCSELEIKNGGEIAMTKDGSIRVTGGITINGTLSGASRVACGKRFYVGSNGIMAFDPAFTLEAGGKFEFHSNHDHANYMGGDSHITAAGMKIRGKCFQFDGTFYTTSSDLDMNNREDNYVELLDLSALGGLVDFDGKKLTNSAPKEYQVCAHNYYYIEMTDSAAEAVAQVLDGIYDEESRSLIEPQMRNGEPDESYYADKIDEQIDEEYGMTPPQYTITASTVPKKHRDAAIEIINRALEDVDIDPMVIESRGIISIGSIQYDLRTYDETVSLKDDNNRSWNVNFKGIKSILNSKVSVFSSDVEMFSGQISCAALNINSQPFTVTSTKEDLQSAAQNIVAIGETEIQKIKNDLLKSVINDALKMIAIQGSLAGEEWLSMTDCVTYAREITSFSVANDLFSFLKDYTEYYSWFADYQEVAENVLVYH